MSATDCSTFDQPRPLFSSSEGSSGEGSDDVKDQPNSLLSVVAVARHLRIPFLPITWQAARPDIGSGSTSKICQSSVGVEVRFAFKRISDEAKLNNSEDKNLQLIINEMIIHSALSFPHGCIAQLQGMCWDVNPTMNKSYDNKTGENVMLEDKVWPALCFIETQHGDLYNFLVHGKGKDLSVINRSKLCRDICDCYVGLENAGIIHGDVKPENILIYSEGHYYHPKIIDFGYSTKIQAENDFVLLPRSWPWWAPEHSDHDRFLPAQARSMDIFSLGMLCLWVMFEKFLSGSKPLPKNTAAWADKYFPDLTQAEVARYVLDGLKQDDRLLLLATQLVRAETALSERLQLEWMQFFRQTLPRDPDSRESVLGGLMERLHNDEFYSYQRQLKKEFRYAPLPINVSECSFDISQSLRSLYQADYRVRRAIRQCLEIQVQNLWEEPGKSFPMFQLAFCYKVGFGGKRDDREARWFLDRSKYDIEELYAAIEAMNDVGLFKDEEAVTGSLYQEIQERGLLADMQFVDHCRNHGMIDECAQALKQELEQIEFFVGHENALWFFHARKLVYLYHAQGLTEETENLQFRTRKTEESLEFYHKRSIKLDNRLESMTRIDAANKQRTFTENIKANFTADMNTPLWDEAILAGLRKLKTMKATNDSEIITLSLDSAEISTTVIEDSLWKEYVENVLKQIDTHRLTLYDDYLDMLPLIRELASGSKRRRHMHVALVLEEHIVRMMTNIYGINHPKADLDLINLAETYQYLGIRLGALEVVTNLTKILRRELGERDKATLTCMSILALLYRVRRRSDEAEQIELQVHRTKHGLGRDSELLPPGNQLMQIQPPICQGFDKRADDEERLDFAWILVRAHVMPMDWERRADDQGRIEYINHETGIITKEPPKKVDAYYLVPQGWTVHRSDDGHIFWLHSGTRRMANRVPGYLPRGWTTIKDNRDQRCWYDTVLQTISYERPLCNPAGWEVREDHLGRTYYFDHAMNTKQYRLPPSMDIWLNQPYDLSDYFTMRSGGNGFLWVRSRPAPWEEDSDLDLDRENKFSLPSNNITLDGSTEVWRGAQNELQVSEMQPLAERHLALKQPQFHKQHHDLNTNWQKATCTNFQLSHCDYPQEAHTGTARSKSVANPWRDRKIAVLASQKAIKKWIRQLRGK